MGTHRSDAEEPIGPAITSDLAPWLALAEPAPLLQATGLEWLAAGRGSAEQLFTCPPDLCESDGHPSFGAISMAADSTLSVAGASSWGTGAAMVTQSLRVELLGELPPREVSLRVRGRTRCRSAESVLVEGDLTTADGAAIGQASLRGVIVARGRSRARASSASQAGTSPENADAPSPEVTYRADPTCIAPVDDALGIEVAPGNASAHVRCVPSEVFASGWRTLHGGVIALIAHRAAHHAIETTAGGRGHHSVTFAIDYLRPIPCDGTPVKAQAVVVTGSRRYVALDVVVLLGDDRPAATVRVTEELLELGPPSRVDQGVRNADRGLPLTR